MILVAVALATMAGAAAHPTTVAAHPLGSPQSLRIGADGQQVWMRWSAPSDDLTALGLHLGVLGGERTFVYDRGVLVPEESDASDAAVLADAPELATYLLEHIRVTQDGAACQGTVTDTQQLADAGVRLSFRCPDDVGEVSVRVDTLTDLHPAYRTLASSDNGERATYTADAAEHRWRLDQAAGIAGYPSGFWLAAAVLVAAGATGGGYLVWRRRSARSGVVT